MSLDVRYTVPANVWEDQSNEGSNPPAFIIGTNAPLHYNSANNTLYCDPASSSQGGYVTTTDQTFRGKKTIVNSQSGQSQLALNDGGNVTTLLLNNSSSSSFAIAGPVNVNITNARLLNNYVGFYESHFPRDAMRPFCAYGSGFTISVTGDHTFDVSAGLVGGYDTSRTYAIKYEQDAGPFAGNTDAFPDDAITYIYVASAPPYIRQSASPQSFANSVAGIALIGFIRKSDGSVNDSIITGASSIQGTNPYDMVARLVQGSPPCTITQIGAFAWNGSSPSIDGLELYAPFAATNPTIIVPSISAWRKVTGRVPSPGVHKTYITPTTTTVIAQYVPGLNYGGYNTSEVHLATTDVGVLLFGYDPIGAYAWWMCSQVSYINDDYHVNLLRSEYVSRCVKYDGLEQSILLGYCIVNGLDDLDSAEYVKWYGRQPFGSL